MMNLDGTLIGIILAIIGAGGLFVKAFLSGKNSERKKQLEERLKAHEIADEVENDIGAIPEEKRRTELKKW